MKRIPKWAWIVLGLLIFGGVVYAFFPIKIITSLSSGEVDGKN